LKYRVDGGRKGNGSDIYKKILIATDGSESGKQAINAGIEIARLSQGKVYALYVIDMAGYPQEMRDPKWKTAMEEHFKTFGLELTAIVEE
jgi:nucleotide-binding universal stress UspA family protein